MLRRLLVACFALAVSGERDARAGYQVTTTTPYPGVTHAVFTDAAVPVRVHLLTVDVSSQEIHLYATQPGERGQTVSDFAACKKGVSGCVPTELAINGDLFQPLGFVPDGLAIGGAHVWPDASMDNATEGYFAFGRPGDINALYLSRPSVVEAPPASLAVEGVVGGRALLVEGGQAQASYDAADPTEPFRFAPRSALGVDAAGRTLTLAVVDGDQASSVGMTASGLADFLAAAGVADAIELDGGGSAELFVKKEGGVVSSPSDGVERPVANHLGIHYGASPYRASIVGKVFDTDFGNDAKTITTATVYVDGIKASWNSTHTLYNVDNIGPHYVCARASAPGFKSAQQCRQITASDIQASTIQYLSLVLYPGTDPPPDMSPPADLAQPRTPPDLAVTRDLASSVADGGEVTLQGGSGCALSGRAPRGTAFPAAVLVVFLGAAILRAGRGLRTRRVPRD